MDDDAAVTDAVVDAALLSMAAEPSGLEARLDLELAPDRESYSLTVDGSGGHRVVDARAYLLVSDEPDWLVERAVEALQRGATDFLTKPADFDHLEEIVDRALEKRRLGRVNRALAEQVAEQGKIVLGTSSAMAWAALIRSKGSRVQSCPSTGTTSVWPLKPKLRAPLRWMNS